MGRRLVFAAIFLIAFGLFIGRARAAGGDLSEPPLGGDQRDYEAIAFNLWKGRGFGYYWSDPQWREPYLRSPRFTAALGDRRSDYYPTTYRPPLFPALWAAVYSVAGRNIAVVRIMNCALMAGAITLAAAIAAHFAGLVAAPVAAILLLQSPHLTQYSRELLTEALATFLVSLLVWLWVSRSELPVSDRAAAISGVVLGLLVLARSIFVLWLPIALLMPGRSVSGRSGIWRARAVCVLACALVVAPWWTRNIIVTGAFLPMGSQGPINLPAGFSQRALDNQGRWRSNPGDGAPELIAAGVDPFSLEYEVRLARHRSALATGWMRDNPQEVVRLMGLHVWQELRPRRSPTAWDFLFPAAVVALLYFRRRPGILPVTLVLCATLLSIALTWGATGRFMVPVQPLMLALVSAMVVSTTGLLVSGLRRLVPAGTRHD
jgi:4-amino-4-deoxy-L-arabinose transferase-like glycosyltransferase